MKTRLPKRMPKPAATATAEREYLRSLLRYQKAFQKLLKDGLDRLVPTLKDQAAEELPDPARMDAARMDANIEKAVRDLFEEVQGKLVDRFPDSVLQRWAGRLVGHVNMMSKRNMESIGKIIGLEVAPLLRDKELTPYFENVVDENVGLIRSIPQHKLATFKNSLVRLITEDAPHSEISKVIAKQFKLTKNQAKLIAVDQVGKLNGAINEYRQQALGGTRYRWRTMGDERVTGKPGGKYPDAEPSHWAREGKIFFWSKPPKGGHPGKRPRCRCYAEMVLGDVVA